MALSAELVQEVKDYVKFRSPDFDVEASTFPMALKVAEDRLSACAFGDSYYEALGLFILHRAEVDDKAKDNDGESVSGVTIKEKEGDLEKTVSVGATSGKMNADYARTGYGQELEALSRSKIGFRTLMTSRMSPCD